MHPLRRKIALGIIVPLAFACLLAGAAAAVARGPDPAREGPPVLSAALFHRPSVVPDRVVLTWTGDPATTQAVTWRTSTDVSDACAEIAPAEAGPRFAGRGLRVPALTRPFESDLSTCRLHSVELTGLEPDTRYAYRVGDGANWSEWFHFRTASAAPEPFSFLYFGDAQTDLRSLWSRVVRQAFSDLPGAAFTLHAGDLVNAADSDAEWGEWFQAGGWIHASIPVIATPGNHEYARVGDPDDTGPRRLTRHWAPQFAFPSHGPAALAETVYYLDYHDCRVVSLNSNEMLEEQSRWLDEVLSRNDRTWTVITFHHSVFPLARGRESGRLRELWKPLFDRHGVDLVLTGHDHVYGRSGLVPGETDAAAGPGASPAPGGTVYVVSTSGSKMYDLDPVLPGEVRRLAEDTQFYQIVSIDGRVLRYEARTATGEIYDAFTLKKGADGRNEMFEQVPDVPERRRAARDCGS